MVLWTKKSQWPFKVNRQTSVLNVMLLLLLLRYVSETDLWGLWSRGREHESFPWRTAAGGLFFRRQTASLPSRTTARRASWSCKLWVECVAASLRRQSCLRRSPWSDTHSMQACVSLNTLTHVITYPSSPHNPAIQGVRGSAVSGSGHKSKQNSCWCLNIHYILWL